MAWTPRHHGQGVENTMTGRMNAAVTTKISRSSAILEMMRANQAGVAPPEMMRVNQAGASPVEVNLVEAVRGVSLAETGNYTINNTARMDTTIEKPGTISGGSNNTNSASNISNNRTVLTVNTFAGKTRELTGMKNMSTTIKRKTGTTGVAKMTTVDGNLRHGITTLVNMTSVALTKITSKDRTCSPLLVNADVRTGRLPSLTQGLWWRLYLASLSHSVGVEKRGKLSRLVT